jgi:hypothetical protein
MGFGLSFGDDLASEARADHMISRGELIELRLVPLYVPAGLAFLFIGS